MRWSNISNLPTAYWRAYVLVLPYYTHTVGIFIKPRYWGIGFEALTDQNGFMIYLGPLHLAILSTDQPESSRAAQRDLPLFQVRALVRDAYREGWKVNAIPETEPDYNAEYFRGCEEADWQGSATRTKLPGLDDAGA